MTCEAVWEATDSQQKGLDMIGWHIDRRNEEWNQDIFPTFGYPFGKFEVRFELPWTLTSSLF